MREEQVRSIHQLLSFINELSNEHKLRLWYRGISKSNRELLPSIQRNEKVKESERYLTNDFYIKAKQVIDNSPAKSNYAAWISLMQHYGLPTRMMDWSCSPLVAAFFATEKYNKYPENDACIWVIVPALLNEREGFGKCIYPVDSLTTQEMLLPAFKEYGHNSELADKIIACYSVEYNLRMYSQQSCFTVHNSDRKLIDVCDEKMLYKIIIPADTKADFLRSLRVFGITESYVYPDLDHISKDLVETFGLS